MILPREKMSVSRAQGLFFSKNKIFQFFLRFVSEFFEFVNKKILLQK